MLHDDVLLRPLRLLLKGVLRAVGLRKQKEFPAAEQHLDELLAQYVGLSRQIVDMSAPETLLSLLTAGGELDLAKALALAHILSERAALYRDGGQAQLAGRDRARALALLEAAHKGEVSLPQESADLYERLSASLSE